MCFLFFFSLVCPWEVCKYSFSHSFLWNLSFLRVNMRCSCRWPTLHVLASIQILVLLAAVFVRCFPGKSLPIKACLHQAFPWCWSDCLYASAVAMATVDVTSWGNVTASRAGKAWAAMSIKNWWILYARATKRLLDLIATRHVTCLIRECNKCLCWQGIPQVNRTKSVLNFVKHCEHIRTCTSVYHFFHQSDASTCNMPAEGVSGKPQHCTTQLLMKSIITVSQLENLQSKAKAQACFLGITYFLQL